MLDQGKFFVRKQQTEPGLCFVIMPFSEGLRSVYEYAIKPFVERIGMRCLRADEIYGGRPIMEDIWNGIQRAELVIADLTERNPNVMYELGLCHALWKKIVLITQKVDDVPFDLKGFRLIPYDPSLGGAARLTDELGRMAAALRSENSDEAEIVPFKQRLVRPVSPTKKTKGVIEAVAKDYIVIRLDDEREARMKRGDFSWSIHVKDLSTKFHVGETVAGVLLSETSNPLSFSMKHQHPNPWPQLQKELPRGKEVTGKVVVVGKFGIFVEVKPHFNGLLSRKQLPRGKSFTEGMTVKAKIASISPERQLILLDYVGDNSQDPWNKAEEKYSIGKICDGVVRDHRKFGVFAELEPGVRGLFRFSEGENIEELTSSLSVGKALKWEVLAFDPQKRRIDLRPHLNGHLTN